ncbi:MAG TPA: NAD(P)-dependent oxidoreductase [Stellaceae bacterium]|nr:NAD(P)-dependent oxidoreductase [Stellaceae bacterium]
MTNNIAGRRIAITGGAGFIGHHLALALKRRGAEVDVIDSLQVNNLSAFAGNADNISNRQLYLHLIHERLDLLHAAGIPVHVLDARDYQTFSPLLATIKPDVIIHLAAIAHANQANKNPYSTFDHSLRTLENALDCSRDRKPHFIYFSSSMVYGNFATGTVTEETHCEPLGIYGALKFSGEKMVIAYNQVFGLPYTIIRPSALYGERCVSRRVGQVFIENALQGLELQISGDGSDRLDFTYVEDVVQGVTKAIENPASRNEIFNLTFGGSRSIAQMVDILRTHFPTVTVKHAPKDRLMPDRGTLSIDKARRLLGYEPAFPLETGFPRYIEWYKNLFARNDTLLRRII